jgi:hypothetical protein
MSWPPPACIFWQGARSSTKDRYTLLCCGKSSAKRRIAGTDDNDIDERRQHDCNNPIGI